MLVTPSWSQQYLSEKYVSRKRNANKTTLTFRNYRHLESSLHPHISPNILEGRSSGRGTWFSNIDYKYNVKLQFVPNNSHVFYSLSEFHITKHHRQTTWSLGRKILPWNPTEARWGLGQLNGWDGISPMNPEEEGLFGFHLKHRAGGWIGEFFASYITLPGINPSYYTQEGRIFSRNEWGTIPPADVTIQDGKAPIHYTIKTPDTKEMVEDILVNGTLGLSLAHRYKAGPIAGIIRTYAIYKPENSLRSFAKSFYNLKSDIGHVRSAIIPFINHHTLLGLGASHKIGSSFTWNIHATHNRPEIGTKKHTPEPIFFELHENYFDSTTITNSLFYEYGHWLLGLHHLNIHQPELYRQGITLGKIPPWHKVLSFSLKYRNKSSWVGLFDIKHDTHVGNTIIKSQLSYHFSNGLALGTRGEIIQAPQTKDINYWSRFRTNDTVQMFLSYQF